MADPGQPGRHCAARPARLPQGPQAISDYFKGAHHADGRERQDSRREGNRTRPGREYDRDQVGTITEEHVPSYHRIWWSRWDDILRWEYICSCGFWSRAFWKRDLKELHTLHSRAVIKPS